MSDGRTLAKRLSCRRHQRRCTSLFWGLVSLIALFVKVAAASDADQASSASAPLSEIEVPATAWNDHELSEDSLDEESLKSPLSDAADFDELNEPIEDQQPLVHQEDQVWLVSSRGISCPNCDDSGLKYYRRVDCRWEMMDRAAFDADLEKPLDNVVFVHGNRTDLNYATRRGMQAYRAFVSQIGDDRTPVRFIAWAWPSERESVGVKDFRAKADRADLEGCLFGAFLRKLPNDQRLNLIGYSFGSRIVLGGITLLAGETLFGRCLELPEDYRPPVLRVTLIAAATPPSSLLPGQLYHRGYELAERWVLINNREDRVLRMYRFVDRSTSSAAMGSIGMATGRLPDQGRRVSQWDVARSIGPQHKIDLYFASGSVGRLVREQLSWISHDLDGDEATTSGAGSTP